MFSILLNKNISIRLTAIMFTALKELDHLLQFKCKAFLS